MDKCFKKLLERLHIIKSTLATAEKKPLRLAMPYLGQSQNKKCYEMHFKLL